MRSVAGAPAAVFFVFSALATVASAGKWMELRGELRSLARECQCGPLLMRLSWHDAGTYKASDRSGGPRAAMRHQGGESSHEANAGLDKAQTFLMVVKDRHPGVSYADIWSLAGVAAIEEMGGPFIAWRPGRKDVAEKGKTDVEEGRLPDATKGEQHLRHEIFYRMGLNDRDIVALSGAHTVGRAHVANSGFEGAWTDEPLKFDNSYFKDLLAKHWSSTNVQDSGKTQFVEADEGRKDLEKPKCMMLNSDMVLLEDPVFNKYVKLYAKDQLAFFKDFSQAFQKLQELGVHQFPAPVVRGEPRGTHTPMRADEGSL